MSEEEVVTVRVGKKGLTEQLIYELDNVLNARGVVKVKLLKNFRDCFSVDKEAKKALAAELAKALNAEIVDIRGYTITLKRPRKRARAR